METRLVQKSLDKNMFSVACLTFQINIKKCIELCNHAKLFWGQNTTKDTILPCTKLLVKVAIRNIQLLHLKRHHTDVDER